MDLAIVIHHTVFRSFDIVELAGLDRPEKDEPAGEADEKHENDKRDDRPEHSVYLNLNEFITTVTELTAIAAAATIGFKSPAIASGIAAIL